MPDLRQIDISIFISKYKLNTFVETGTGHGNALRKALSHKEFSKLYSTEIITQQYDLLKPEFENNNRVRLYNEPSHLFIQDVCRDIPKDDRVFYWLDSHYPGADLHMGNCHLFPGVDCNKYDAEIDEVYRLPLIKELSAIGLHRGFCKDVIFMDDLGIFIDPNIKDEFKPKSKNGDFNFYEFVKILFPLHKPLQIVDCGYSDTLCGRNCYGILEPLCS